MCFDVVAVSSVRETHALFIKLLEQPDLQYVYEKEWMLAYIEKWIASAEKIMPKFAYDKDWYSYTLSILKFVTKNKSDEIQERIIDYFYRAAKKYLPEFTPAIKDIVTVELLSKPSSDEAKSVFNRLKFDLEKCIVQIAEKSNWENDSHVTSLKNVVTNPDLFETKEIACKLLEALASSHVKEVHMVFLDAMATEQYWKILQTENIQSAFEKWISVAKDTHCQKKSKCRKGKSRQTDYIPYMYEYLAEMKKLPILNEQQNIWEETEALVKQECLQLDQNARQEMMEVIPEISQEALDLLKCHIDDANKETMSLSDLEQGFNRCGKRDFNKYSRYNYLLH